MRYFPIELSVYLLHIFLLVLFQVLNLTTTWSTALQPMTLTQKTRLAKLQEDKYMDMKAFEDQIHYQTQPQNS